MLTNHGVSLTWSSLQRRGMCGICGGGGGECPALSVPLWARVGVQVDLSGDLAVGEHIERVWASLF